MPAASQLITSFLGGEISAFFQGRYDRPDYRTSLRVCLNAFPLESGAWTRRPGSKHAGTTRGGLPARVMRWDFEAAAPITTEFTDGYVRFRSGAPLITTNDAQAIVAISTANPAVVQVANAVTWATGDTAILPGASTPLLENRQFKLTKVDTTHFSIADAVTGVTIDGSTLGALAVGATIAKVHELATVYIGGLWSGMRMVQAETSGILLQGTLAPQILSVSTLPSAGINPVFAINSAIFLDGPYLDPPTNGAQITPSATKGLVTLTLSFPAYDSGKAYKVGDFITYSSVNYTSLTDQNVGNTPNTSPTQWQATTAGAAINGGSGFLGSDVGRLVRLFSEPTPWASGSTYAQGNIVSYNPSGIPGATTYWQSLVGGNTGNVPGADTSHWALETVNTAALWSWGKITALSNTIDRALAGSVAIGTMIGNGGLAAAFDGVFSQAASACAEVSASFNSPPILPPVSFFTVTGYVGKNFTGATPQKIKQVTVYPANDAGFSAGSQTTIHLLTFPTGVSSIVFNLRAKQTAPASSSDGTLLGTVTNAGNTTSAVSITSSDQATSWNYVWIEIVATNFTAGDYVSTWSANIYVAELSMFAPTSTGVTDGITAEILGPTLPSTNVVQTWRLGAYSNTTGWPTCGCWDGGRLFLGGAIANRWDACVSNGISGNTINFAPTDQYGNVAANNAISYTFNSDGVNQILWMSPELQGVLMGTLAGEWLVQAPTNGPLAPNNVAARRVTKIGGAFVEPCRTEHTTLFVKRYARKLMEYFADVFSGKYSAPNLADKAQHVTKAGIAEVRYTEAVNPIVWERDLSGGLGGITYKRDSLTSSQGPTFYAWHRHALGSGRTVESICAGPSVGGTLDALTMVTNDASTGIRHVEILTDVQDETAALAASWFLDDAVNPTSVTSSPTGLTINGLWHLNGKTVQVFAGGLDCGDRGDEAGATTPLDFVVANGSVFVPYGDGVSAGPGAGLFTSIFTATLPLSQIVVGFTYNSDGQIVRLVAQADTGARNGPALGAPSRTHRAALKFVNAKGVKIGGNFSRLYPCLFKAGTDSVKPLPALSTFSGVFYDQVKDDFTYDDSLCWRIERPFPATITALTQNLRTEDV